MANHVVARFGDGRRLMCQGVPPNRPPYFVVPVDSDRHHVRHLIERAALIGTAPISAPQG